jgi:hypothetical protein
MIILIFIFNKRGFPWLIGLKAQDHL